MFTWTRTERGESALQIIVGATLGLMVLGGFTQFWVTADRSAAENVAMTGQESSALQVLNRVGRDIQDASAILYASPTVLVLEKHPPNRDSLTRIRFEITEDAVTQQIWSGAPEVYDHNAWASTDDCVANAVGAYPAVSAAGPDPDGTQTCQVVATDVRDPGGKTKFVYVDTDGDDVTVEPALFLPDDEEALGKVARVDTSFAADAGAGYVELKSSAAVDVLLGGGARPAGPPPAQPVTCNANLAVSDNGAGDAPVLTWDDVPTATGYKILVDGTQVATDTGSPWVGASGAYAAGRTYTLSVVPFDANGDAAGPCPMTSWSLVAPAAPPPTTPGEFGLNAWAANYSINHIEWGSRPGATSYRIEARRIDTGAAWGTVATITGTSYDHKLVSDAPATTNQSMLGSTFEYRVVAIGAGETSDSASVVQFPPDPVATAVGSDRDGDMEPDAVGSNLVTWSAARSATAYDVTRYTAEIDPMSGYVSTVAQGGPVRVVPAAGSGADVSAGRSYTHTGLPRGSERLYVVSAVNRCTLKTGPGECPSPNSKVVPPISQMDAAYQVPAVPTTTISAKPTLAALRYTAAVDGRPDEGATGSQRRFCTAGVAGAKCQYRMVRDGSVTDTRTDIRLNTLTDQVSDWGKDDWVAARSCNAGGCSPIDKPDGTWIADQRGNYNVKWVHAYPGPFRILRLDFRDEFFLNNYNSGQSTPNSRSQRIRAGMQIKWNDSIGVRSGDGAYKIHWESTRRDPNNRHGNKTTGAAANSWPKETDGFVPATPGAQYLVRVTSEAPNGLDRPVEEYVTVPPPPVAFFQVGTFCNDDVRKIGEKCTTTSEWTGAWTDCNNEHAATNPNSNVCVNKSGMYNYHWMRKKAGDWVYCLNPHGRSNPNPGTCVNKADSPWIAKHWKKKVYKDVTTCTNVYGKVNDEGWKAGFRYTPFGLTADIRDSDSDYIRLGRSVDAYEIRWFRGHTTNLSNTSNFLYNGLANAEQYPNPSEWLPKREYGMVRGNVPVDPGTYDEFMGGLSNMRLMDNFAGAGGAMGIQAINAPDGNSRYGDSRSQRMTVNLYKVGDGPVSCVSGSGWHWNGNPHPVNRWAYPRSRGDYAPSGSNSDWAAVGGP